MTSTKTGKPLPTPLHKVWRRLWPGIPQAPESALTPGDIKRGLPDWASLLHDEWPQWRAAVRAARGGPRVLLATSVGGYLGGTNLESLLAVALTLRGAHVQVLLCDAFLPACHLAGTYNVPAERLLADGLQPHLCEQCSPRAHRVFLALGLTIHDYSHWVSAQERLAAHTLAQQVPMAAISQYRYDGLAVGEHALAGALRYFARGVLDDEPEADAVLRRYFEASLLTVTALQNLLRREKFASACFNHGLYVPQGLVGEVARQAGVRVSNWNPAYRKQCFIFSHNETYHHTLLSEPTSTWTGLPWTPELENEILAYLKSRWQGTQDWIWFHEKPQEDTDAMARELGIDFGRPCIGMLTNVMWDAQLHYPANAFANMLEWVLTTVEYFAARPDLQLVIRIHPAEVRGTIASRQPLAAEISRAFPKLPANVFVVAPESHISTYALMQRCRVALIYGTKMGVELTSQGMPVIVAGEAWIRNKGLTYDASSRAEYLALLERLPNLPPADEATLRRARQYAYHFFFRRMIPLDMVVPNAKGAPYKVQLESLEELRPGRSPGLDSICEGILNGSEFIYPAEQFAAPLTTAMLKPQ